MSKKDYSIIDTAKWSPIQSPGLRAQKHQVAYDSVEIQKLLSESFASMFPSIIEISSEQKRYQSLNENGVDVFPKAHPAKNISDIPKAEMMRLMEGWIRLRRKLQEQVHPNNVTAILLNFRVPNPRQSLDRYMLYKRGEETRLMIRWGYETADEKAVSLERAISILMDVPLGHMRSILSTTMSQTTSTVPVGPLLAAAEAQEKLESQGQGKSLLIKAAAAVALLCVAGASYALVGGQKEEALSATAKEEFVFAPELFETAPEVVTDPVKMAAAPVEEIKLEMAEEPAVSELPSLDAIAPAKAKKEVALDAMFGAAEAAKSTKSDLLSEML